MLGNNNHPKAYVTVLVHGLRIEYSVHVARLQTAVHGAWRRFPTAREVEATRERPMEVSRENAA